VAVSGAAVVERDLALSHAAYVGFVFAGPQLAASLLEVGVALLSDVWERRRLMSAGQAGLAVALLFAAWTRSPWGLSVGLAFAGATSGVACGAAQALLVAGDPRGPDRAMVRWTLYASVGDLLAPLLTAASIALGFSFRGAMIAIAVVVVVQCALSAIGGKTDPSPNDESSDAEPPADALRAALGRAARRPRLWLWLFVAALCTLLDEIVVALAVLRLNREEGVPVAFATTAALVFAGGAIVGSAVSDGAVARFGGRRVLVASALLCGLALGASLASHTPLATCAALFVVGIACAPHHALAFARAYDEMPGNPGTVQAVAQLFVVVDIAAPMALGVLADRFGLRAAMACLALQPLVILLGAAVAPDRERPAPTA
jgi:MFS family permease